MLFRSIYVYVNMPNFIAIVNIAAITNNHENVISFLWFTKLEISSNNNFAETKIIAMEMNIENIYSAFP